ncbi:MAG TPA: DapH/DapD/GlmU-related protein [Candidatus Limiplasma sp.]|nr:DapH/DapD/GlmU-related protein [Candidatus Limiplasma sp.]HPS80422.1 DapH/DapD/GlmU-related protein [Candidatus Limiplasma sp.]
MLNRQPNLGLNVLLQQTTLGDYVQILDQCALEECDVGDFSYLAGYNQVSYAHVGKFCSIATFVRINPGNHPAYTRVAQHHFTYRSELFGLGEDDAAFFDWRREHPVTIGHDVWIGHGATVMPGVTVGNGAVIGTGAIVTHDVEPYAVVAGVPARKIKMRFDPTTVDQIERIAWWNWDLETLRERLPDFQNFEQFRQKYLLEK